MVSLFMLISLMMNAQTINFSFPSEVGKTYNLIVPNGLQSDTIARGTVNAMGGGRILMPEKYKGIPAIGLLKVGDKLDVNVILDGKDVSIILQPDGGVTFRDSVENELLNNQRPDVLSAENKETYAQFYVNVLMALRNVMQLQSSAGRANLFDKTNARLNLIKVIDVDKLYYSQLWYFAIDGLLKLSIGQEGFAADMIKLLDKTKTDAVYIALLEDLIMLTSQYGMEDAFDQIVMHAKERGRIKYPQGRVYDAFTMMKVRKGNKAPDVKGLNPSQKPYTYNLVFFYQPSCDHCHEQLMLLNDKISFFEKEKVRIISLSAALDKDQFEKERPLLKWEDQLCDYKGFAGDNFINFGVVATPVMYLLDAKGNVLGRFSGVAEVCQQILNAQNRSSIG